MSLFTLLKTTLCKPSWKNVKLHHRDDTWSQTPIQICKTPRVRFLSGLGKYIKKILLMYFDSYLYKRCGRNSCRTAHLWLGTLSKKKCVLVSTLEHSKLLCPSVHFGRILWDAHRACIPELLGRFNVLFVLSS